MWKLFVVKTGLGDLGRGSHQDVKAGLSFWAQGGADTDKGEVQRVLAEER